MPLVAFCLRHFLADSIICMCVFDFRQAQPEREVMTGIGPVAVRQPRVRDREADATDPDRIRFSPSASDADEAIDILTSRFDIPSSLPIFKCPVPWMA